MKSLSHKFLFLMFILSLAIGCYLLIVTLKHPYIGITVEKDQQYYKVIDVTKIGLGKFYGIVPGDIILKVDRQDPDKNYFVNNFSTVEQSSSIVIKNEKGIQTLLFSYGNGTSKQFFYHIIFPLVVFLINFLLSFLVYIKKKDCISTPIFIVFFLTMGILYLDGSASGRSDYFSLLLIIGIIYLPIFLLHFIYLYLKEYGLEIFQKRVLSFIYIFNAIILLVSIALVVSLNGIDFIWVRYYILIFFSLNLFFSITLMIKVYITFRKTIYAPIFHLLSWGLIFSFFPFVGFFALPTLFLGYPIIEGEVSALFIVFFPLVFLYLIMANRLLDIDFVLGRIRYYSVLSVFSTVIIWLFLHDVIRLEKLNGVTWTRILVFTFILNIIFLYIKEELDYRFRFKLFARKFDYQSSLNRFSKHISKVMKVSNLEESIIKEIKDVLSIKKVSIIEMTKKNYSPILKKGDVNFPYEEIHETFKHYMGTFEVAELMELRNGTCVIIGGNTDKVNILWFEDRMNRIRLNQNEIEWVTTLSRHVSIVYENLHLIEGLFKELEEMRERNKIPPWMIRLLFNIQEKERRRLSADLHDSALQEQLIWYRRLETLVESRQIPDDMADEVEMIKEGLLDVIHQIRETCNELRPPFLREMGIVKALDNLFLFAQLRNDYVVDFDATQFHEELDDEYSLVLYRIVQELLTNAAKHSHSSYIHLILKNNEECIELSYKDNGVGMDITEVTPSYKHIGLSAIKERVHSLEGEIVLISSPGTGVEVEISIPLHIMKEVLFEESYAKQM